MRGGKKAEQLGSQRDIEKRNDPEPKRPAQLAWLAAEFLEEIFHLAKNGLGMFLKDAAGGRKQNAFTTAMKKRYAKSGFEVADLLRDARL